jgi:small-conductance mechanosensitive channel
MPRPSQPAEEIAADCVPLVERAMWGVGAFLLVYLIGRLVVVRGIVRLVAARNSRTPTLVEAVERYTHLAVVLLAIAAGLSAAGFGHLLTGSAIVVAAVALAVGVAGLPVIGNVVSGLFPVVDPDFNVGDWIVWEDGEGIVETIRLRVTHVRTPSPSVVVTDLGDDAGALQTTLWTADPSHGAVVNIRSAYAGRAKARLQAEGFTVSPSAEHDLPGRLTVDGDADGPGGTG